MLAHYISLIYTVRMKKAILLHLKQEQLDLLSAESERRDVSRAALIRKAIDTYMRRNGLSRKKALSTCIYCNKPIKEEDDGQWIDKKGCAHTACAWSAETTGWEVIDEQGGSKDGSHS